MALWTSPSGSMSIFDDNWAIKATVLGILGVSAIRKHKLRLFEIYLNFYRTL